MKTLSFPDDMRNPLNENKPYVKIAVEPEVGTQLAKGEDQVCLFMPDDIGLNTAANYGDTEIGAGEALAALKEFGGSRLTNADAGVIQQAISKIIPGSDKFSVTTKMAVAQKAIFNPQAVTLFQGVTIRDYGLTYTFAPKNARESAIMTDIENFFRMHSLPEATDGWSMKFPSLFTVTFMVGDEFNDYFPVYYPSYITGVNVVMNPNGRAFFANGAPTSMTLTVEFKETKQVTRDMMYHKNTIIYNKGKGGMRPSNPKAVPPSAATLTAVQSIANGVKNANDYLTGGKN
jgi:hypothetical protein